MLGCHRLQLPLNRFHQTPPAFTFFGQATNKLRKRSRGEPTALSTQFVTDSAQPASACKRLHQTGTPLRPGHRRLNRQASWGRTTVPTKASRAHGPRDRNDSTSRGRLTTPVCFVCEKREVGRAGSERVGFSLRRGGAKSKCDSGAASALTCKTGK